MHLEHKPLPRYTPKHLDKRTNMISYTCKHSRLSFRFEVDRIMHCQLVDGVSIALAEGLPIYKGHFTSKPERTQLLPDCPEILLDRPLNYKVVTQS